VKVYHCHVSILCYDPENNLREKDLAKEKNSANMNIDTVKQVISDHKEWKVNNRANDSVGLAYDGCSSFYSTALLPLPYTTDGRTATVDVTYTPKLQTIISLRFLWWKIGKLKFSRTK
jgi:hypothetical protein